MKTKRLFSLLLTLCLLLSCIPAVAYAEEEATLFDSGTDDGITWEYFSDGFLKISGNGPIPWYSDFDQYSDSIISVYIDNGITAIPDDCFYYYTALENITIPGSVTSIGDSAFDSCESLKSVILPEGITEIPDGCFSWCTALENVSIPSSVTSIGGSAFSWCESLKSISLPDGITAIPDMCFERCSALENINIPDSVVSIGYDAFSYCSSLKAVTIPENVSSIDESAFGACTSLESVNIPNGITEIGPLTFAECWELETIEIPSSVTSIGEEAFRGCKSLKSITLPYGITEIPYACFQVTSLENVNIPATVVSIDDYAFHKCASLKSVTIPDSVTDIGDCAFYECESLDSITIPASVTYIDDFAFAWSPALRSITFTGNAPTLGEFVFSGLYATVYYPSDNTTWTKDIRQDYGGTITWKAMGGQELAITRQPTTGYTKSGETASVSVEAEGEGLTYQWYIKNSGSSKYSKSSITAPTYTCTMNSKTKDRLVYCVVTDQNGETIKSNTVRLRMAATITKQPADASAASGSSAKVSVTAVGDGLTYQWYVKNPGKTAFSKSSVTKSSYSCKMSSSTNGRQVYCVVTDKYGNTDQSETVTFRLPATITRHPATGYAKSGETVSVSLKAEGEGLTYQWYVKNSGASKYSKSSVKTATYTCTMSSKTKDRLVYCVVTDAYGNQVKSKTVRLRMAATITKEPASVTVDKGDTAKVTVKAAGDGLKYTWYVKNPGKSSYSKSSVTKSSYSCKMSRSVDGRKVYCVVTDKYGNQVKSKTVSLNMD